MGDWYSMEQRTGKVGVDRRLTSLENDVHTLQSAIRTKRAEAQALWEKHAPWYIAGERVRGGNSGGWE